MTEDFPIIIYHNPRCGTSRNTLAMIQAAGYTPEIVDYVSTGWTKGQLRDLLAAMGVPARDILRSKEKVAAELGLIDPGISDSRLIDAMVAHPILVNRPIVRTPKGVRLCRPSENVFDLLEHPPETFTKEDGEVITR